MPSALSHYVGHVSEERIRRIPGLLVRAKRRPKGEKETQGRKGDPRGAARRRHVLEPKFTERLVRHIEGLGAVLVREGGRHSVYENPYTKGTIAVPRHAEVNDHTAKSIIRAAGERPK